jgi:hypothetical protein
MEAGEEALISATSTASCTGEVSFDHLMTELYDLIPDTAFSMGRLQ